nr:MAG TPA: hypothetical protein [Caudoviricetes sp.]
MNKRNPPTAQSNASGKQGRGKKNERTNKQKLFAITTPI